MKTMHNLSVTSYLLFRELAKDYSPRDKLSDNSEELFKEGDRIYRSFCCNQTSKDYC